MASIESNARQSVEKGVSLRVDLPTILIVDDSHDTANMLGTLFGAGGYETHVVYDWAAALDAARTHRPDVFLLDLGMPELDGVHLARLIREDSQFKGSILVAVTGYADELHRRNARRRGLILSCRSRRNGKI